MVEVFKTNVSSPGQAEVLIRLIHQKFEPYNANFDLQDCDKILRVESPAAYIDATSIIEFLKQRGFESEVLADEVPFNVVTV